jgi:hypothetical protein
MKNTWCYKQPAYRPKPSASIRTHAHAHTAVQVQSDNDLWVEHSYQNKEGQDNYYYCSMLTGKSQKIQPPTGAAVTVYQEEIAVDPTLRCRLPGPLSMQEIREMPHPTPSLYGASRRGGIRTLVALARIFSTRRSSSIDIPTRRSSFDSVSSFSRV